MPRGVFIRTKKYIVSEETKLKISLAQKGRKKSPETIAKMVKWRTGRKLSKGWCEAIGKGHSGEKSKLWKGGVTPENHIIRCKAKYKSWRRGILERDNYTCVQCGEKEKRLIADHIKPFIDFPELRFDIDNGRTLCDKCHQLTPDYGWKKFHSKDHAPIKYFMKPVIVFDGDGNFKNEYESATAAANKLGIKIPTIFAYLNNRIKQPYNLIIKYKNVC